MRLPLKKILFSLLSSLLLVMAFPAWDIWPLLWIGFIPLLLALEDTTVLESYRLGVIAGWAGICGAYPWITHVTRVYMEAPVPVNYLIWLFYGFYHGQLFGIATALQTWLTRKTGLPVILIFPLTMTVVWSLFPALFFFNLANGTAGFTLALQAMDITGVYGLDYIIILANALAYSVIRYGRKKTPLPVMAAALVLLIAWFGYGIYSLDYWQKEISGRDIRHIGIVQPNRPSSLYILPPEEGYSTTYPVEMALSRSIVENKPEIIIWPEGNFYGYFEDISVRVAFMKQVRDMGIPLLFHDYPWDLSEKGKLFRNSATLINKDGTYGGRYDKRYIVAFGEYIPFVNYDWPLIRDMDLPPPLTPGNGPVTFTAGGMKINPLICYETQFSRFVAESLDKDPRGKIITVQSNDGWYGRGPQAAQHNSSIILRAVENRVPVVHVMNNGPSTVARPDGIITFRAPFMERGAWITGVPYSEKKGGSFYTAHPTLFIIMARILFLCFPALLLFQRFAERRNDEEVTSPI